MDYSNFLYLERFVNNGSPTGLTFRNSSSLHTSPRNCCGNFSLPHISLGIIEVMEFNWNNYYTKSINNFLYPIHPDLISLLNFEYKKEILTNSDNNIFAIPTSSPRTLFISVNNKPLFLKLDYPRILGRFQSSLNFDKAYNSIEISNYLVANERGILFFPEVAYIVPKTNLFKKFYSGGAIIRLAETNSPSLNNSFTNYFPSFSLISKDYLKSLTEGEIFEKYFIESNKSATSIIIEKILKPVLRDYWDLSLIYGLIPECHMQNLLFGKIENSTLLKIIWRDMQGMYIDNEFINSTLKYSNSYHFLKAKNHSKVVRSFLYDWILGHYFIFPLINALSKNYVIESNVLLDYVKTYTNKRIKNLDYFPKNKWFSMSLELTKTAKLPFIENNTPLLR